MVTVGVVGCGGISRFHFSGFEKAGAKVKWVCDLNEAAARPWAEKFGAKYTKDYMDIMNDTEVSTVDITATSSVHLKVGMAAIAARKAVICEKTLATNPEDSFALVKAAEEAGTCFYTSYMKRFFPAMEKMKELLPQLGMIQSSTIRSFQYWGIPWGDGQDRKWCAIDKNIGMSWSKYNYGGGMLVCGGSHVLDLTCFLLGRPTRLYGTMFTPSGTDVDLQGAALMETANGIVHYEALAHTMRNVGFLRDSWDESVEINGENGRLEFFSTQWDNPYNKAALLIHTDNAGQIVQYTYDAVSPFDRAIAFFCANIEKGVQGTQERRTGYDVDELIAHIEKSAKLRQAVDIAWKM